MKWLKQLQEERRLLEEKKEAEQKQQLERKRLFMEREAKKRAAGKVSNDGESKDLGNPSAPSIIIDQDTDDSVASSIASTTAESKRKKPAWCQSETDHEASKELAELNDEANLLDFVDGLDFDRYNEDLELQTLMGQVKERIKTLERENKKEETKLQTCLDVSSSFRSKPLYEHKMCLNFMPYFNLFQSETAARRAEALENGPVVDFVPTDIGNDEEDADDAKSIADSVMSQSTIGSIHSKKSLTALVSKAKERMSEMTPIDEEDGEEKAMPPPVLSTVTDDDGARMAEKKSINKLAFKNRNPAL